MDANNELEKSLENDTTNQIMEGPRDEGERKNIIDRVFSWKILSAVMVIFAGIIGYLILERANFSSAKVDILVEGPEQFKAQERTEFKIGFVNNSEAELDKGILYVTVPEFLEVEGNDGVESKFEFSNVGSKEKFFESLSVVSKESNVDGAIKVRVEYTPSNLNKIFSNEKQVNFKVESLPLTVIFTMPDKVVNGQVLEGSFDFVADKNLDGGEVYAKLELPEGFVLEDSEPRPSDDGVWKFEGVNPQDNYRVDFEGSIRGKEGEIKNFKLMFGKLDDSGAFASQYEISKSVSMSSSPLRFDVKINGRDGDYSVSPGDKLIITVSYENKSGVDIEDLSVRGQFIGDIFDFGTLSEGVGYFNENNKTVLWNQNFLPDLAELKDGEMGSIDLSVSITNRILPKNSKDKNKSGAVVFIIESGKAPLSLRGLSVMSESEIKMKLNSVLEISSKGYYYEGPMTNSGPVPPVLGDKTTYTITWLVTNTTNDINEVQVVAALSSDIKFENKAYPAGAVLDYDASTHTVVWNIGSLAAGVGTIFPAESASFQISLTPDRDAVGKTVELMEGVKVIGLDGFTGEFLEGFSDYVDTALSDDSGVGEGDGVVRGN